ncbi:ubiquinol oxidase [Marchantia polymorpha subsp. ruderalis]|uniref:Ubiquinol oxidase n=1 Tax=Marchantia polymorpha subsp. ruderalis TaxID=1480154 RepID=A0A176VYI1_MARPO|nr:hypothetical protein AXG93_4620s1360 [Marchantia polymorpha subsp. ruderalis]
MSLICRSSSSRRAWQRLGVLIVDRGRSSIAPHVAPSSKLLARNWVEPGPPPRHSGHGDRSGFLLTGRQISYGPLAGGGTRWHRSYSSEASSARRDEEAQNDDKHELVRSQYWGIVPKKFTRDDGSPWPWNCFRPTETHPTDVTIDVDKHYKPTSFGDKFAHILVGKILTPMSEAFFQERWGCHAVLLETVAAIPGMVGGMLLHLRSLRRFEHSGGWIKALLEEAENERMHLMTFMEICEPRWYERALVIVVQGVFFNAYMALYLLSPQLAHRLAGYLEEVAVHSYTRYLAAVDRGEIENVPAPAIAIDYWRLPPDARLRDVIIVVRADEAHHRDVQHFAADIRKQGKQLHEHPAPVGYQ